MGFVAFTRRAARARSVADVAASLIDECSELVGARAVGLYVFEGNVAHVRGVPSRLLDKYEQFARPYDPVLRDVNRSHAPSSASLRSMIALAKRQRMPESFIELLDPVVGLHYMVAPVIVGGELGGTIHFARGEDRAFGARELSIASALALHVSTRLTQLEVAPRVDPSWEELLTPRGLEVARLAARGLTTIEVGRALGVSSNTVKKHLRNVYQRLAVGSRAELATALAQRRTP